MNRQKTIAALFVFILLAGLLFAQETRTFPFLGEISQKNINVRSDSTVSAQIICTLNKGNYVEVVAGLYEWCKIRLPKTAPAFIRKDLVTLIDEKSGKVSREKVNIRLSPNESAPIIGKANGGETVNILGLQKGWYKIEPVHNAFGWINERFVKKVIRENALEKKEPPQAEQVNKIEAQLGEEGKVTVEGMLKTYGNVFKRQATHRLIAQDKKIFLLRGNRTVLNALTNYKVRVIGKILDLGRQEYPIIQVEKIEVLE